MEFLKSTELSLNAAGYLVSETTGKPVTHSEFVNQQKNAEYIVKLAAAIKDANFTPSKVDNLEAIKVAVKASMAGSTQTYVTAPTKPTSQVNDELVKFALDFNSYEDAKLQSEKINVFMQQFNSVNDVEQVGDYFTEGVVKLSAIYDIKTILEAIRINVEKLK